VCGCVPDALGNKNNGALEYWSAGVMVLSIIRYSLPDGAVHPWQGQASIHSFKLFNLILAGIVMKKNSVGFVLIVIIAGALVGSAMGEIVAYILPSGVVEQFFLKAVTASFEPGTLNIVILTITLGFSIKVNIMSVIGILIAAYVLRWIN
jgi:hypothetical protein